MLLNQSQYAKVRGVTRAAVSKAVAEGRIQLVKGLVDPATAAAAQLGAEVNGSASSGLTANKQEREHWRAKRERLFYEKAAGQILQAADVESILLQVCREGRDVIMSIGQRLAAELAAITDPTEVRRRIDLEARRACEALSGLPAKIEALKAGKP